jgi:CHAT domain-containing protein
VLLQKAVGRDRPRIWWCVTGELSFLPIHAAGKYRKATDECAADYIVSSYVPTLSALTKARASCPPIPRAEVTGLALCEESSGRNRLKKVLHEVQTVRECFEKAHAKVLNTPSAHTKLAEMKSLLETKPAHVLHLASHGVQATQPLKSSFVLQDGNLAIEDIMRLNLSRAVLAFLSACQTAKGDRDVPDQAVHLAASMLFCGFKSVVGTMW